MPYAPKFEHALQGIAHGWHPRKGSLRKISPAKARAMVKEAHGKHKGQIRAMRRISGEDK